MRRQAGQLAPACPLLPPGESVAHAGITYTPSALLCIVVLIFPIGLFAGYLMRATNGILAPGIFHAGFDLAIYVAYLTYVA